MPGTNNRAENSMVPSTLKWDCASGSRNSLKVVLKKLSYSSWPTYVNNNTHAPSQICHQKAATNKTNQAELQAATWSFQASITTLSSEIWVALAWLSVLALVPLSLTHSQVQHCLFPDECGLHVNVHPAVLTFLFYTICTRTSSIKNASHNLIWAHKSTVAIAQAKEFAFIGLETRKVFPLAALRSGSSRVSHLIEVCRG